MFITVFFSLLPFRQGNSTSSKVTNWRLPFWGVVQYGNQWRQHNLYIETEYCRRMRPKWRRRQFSRCGAMIWTNWRLQSVAWLFLEGCWLWKASSRRGKMGLVAIIASCLLWSEERPTNILLQRDQSKMSRWHLWQRGTRTSSIIWAKEKESQGRWRYGCRGVFSASLRHQFFDWWYCMFAYVC